jgi:hypothetical protein
MKFILAQIGRQCDRNVFDKTPFLRSGVFLLSSGVKSVHVVSVVVHDRLMLDPPVLLDLPRSLVLLLSHDGFITFPLSPKEILIIACPKE